LKAYCEESKKNVETELLKTKVEYGEKIEQLNLKIEEAKKADNSKSLQFEKDE
jgi:hypothetical protein